MAFGDLFLEDLPVSLGPLSKTGEYHTFVQDGPDFIRPVLLERGENAVQADRFYFCTIIPS